MISTSARLFSRLSATRFRRFALLLALMGGAHSAAWATEVTPPMMVQVMPVQPSRSPSDRELIEAPEPVAAGPGEEASTGPSRVRLTTVPPGVSFEILDSAYETPTAKVLRSGKTPATVRNLPPGAYRVRFTSPGLPQRSASVQVGKSGEAVLERDFPHGLLKVRTAPLGAEIFCDGRLVGLSPATLPMLPGSHEITTRLKGRTSRPKRVKIVVDRTVSVSFDFTPPKAPQKARPPVKEKAAPKPLWKKAADSVKNAVTGAVRALTP